MLGYDRDEILGHRVTDYVHPEDVDRVMAGISETVANPDETVTVRFRFRHRDGSWRWLEGRGNNQLENPAVVGMVVNSRDITEQVAIEKRLQRQNERLEDFTSVVSHDLRKPLTVAMGRLELAAEDCSSPHLSAVAAAHDRMETLVEDLLALARHGHPVGEREPLALDPTVEGCWTTVETTQASLVSETDRTLRADRSRFEQLLENLIRNAVEHGGTGVTVRVGDLDDGFYIEDDGPGIPAEHRSDVFEYGFLTGEEGSGFGLAIVREIVDAHGWEIEIAEGATGGARFEITGPDMAG